MYRVTKAKIKQARYEYRDVDSAPRVLAIRQNNTIMCLFILKFINKLSPY